jgi:hypothetical protein
MQPAGQQQAVTSARPMHHVGTVCWEMVAWVQWINGKGRGTREPMKPVGGDHQLGSSTWVRFLITSISTTPSHPVPLPVFSPSFFNYPRSSAASFRSPTHPPRLNEAESKQVRAPTHLHLRARYVYHVAFMLLRSPGLAFYWPCDHFIRFNLVFCVSFLVLSFLFVFAFNRIHCNKLFISCAEY